MQIKVKRVYEDAAPDDGRRFLVDRLWPRGIKKEALHMEAWLKEAAPSDTLRKQFHHDPEKWDEFKRAYFAELDADPDTWQLLLEAAQAGPVTLLYAAKDEQFNNAVALKEYLLVQAP
jgi:uncharacterized protein YeaO (DUF488 family)